MDKLKLYRICTDTDNLETVLKAIGTHVQLKDKLLDHSIDMVTEQMKHNIDRLKRLPRDEYEVGKVLSKFNEYCINKITEAIIKKYPDAKIVRRNAGQEKMRRDMDTFGKRDIVVSDRPTTMGKKGILKHTNDDNDYDIKRYVESGQGEDSDRRRPRKTYVEDPDQDQFEDRAPRNSRGQERSSKDSYRDPRSLNDNFEGQFNSKSSNGNKSYGGYDMGQNVNNVGVSAADNFGGGNFASAFGDHMITTQVPRGGSGQGRNNGTIQEMPDRPGRSGPGPMYDQGPSQGQGYDQGQGQGPNQGQDQDGYGVNRNYSKKDSGFDQNSFNSYISNRDAAMAREQRPQTPDFTLDGSGDKVREERRRRQVETNNSPLMGEGGFNNADFNGGMQSGPMGWDGGGGFGGFGGFAPIGGPMGGGMPGQMAPMGGGMPQMGNQMPNPMGQMQMPVMPNFGTSIPPADMNDPLAALLGGGAPPVSMPAYGQQMPPIATPGYQSSYQTQPFNGNSAKATELSSAYEQKMAERNQIDYQTGQPSNRNGFSNGGGGGGYQGGNMGGNMGGGGNMSYNPGSFTPYR